jgi:hypothetical protein
MHCTIQWEIKSLRCLSEANTNSRIILRVSSKGPNGRLCSAFTKETTHDAFTFLETTYAYSNLIFQLESCSVFLWYSFSLLLTYNDVVKHTDFYCLVYVKDLCKLVAGTIV